MSMHYLGESFDIHGGGEDLIFPHHENEIAQSEAATGRPFVRCWIHNGFVKLGEEKMSKSLGNIRTVKELVRHYDPDAIRLYLLGTHYRNPVEFTEEHVAEATRALGRIRGVVEEADRLGRDGHRSSGSDGQLESEIASHRRRFEAAMDDDFNTPQAIGSLFELVRTLQSARSQLARGEASSGPLVAGIGELLTLCRVLGLGELEPRPAPAVPEEMRERIEALMRARAEARARRDWAEADRIRGELSRLGVTVEDTRRGTVWRWRS
jgi:cysteinyl-tRNA synthetase